MLNLQEKPQHYYVLPSHGYTTNAKRLNLSGSQISRDRSSCPLRKSAKSSIKPSKQKNLRRRKPESKF